MVVEESNDYYVNSESHYQSSGKRETRKKIYALQYFLDYPYLVYPVFDYPSIGSDNT